VATVAVAQDYPATAKPREAGTWTNMPSLPKPRQEHSVVGLNNKIFVIASTRSGCVATLFTLGRFRSAVCRRHSLTRGAV
jgi:hypothetical protein